MKHIPLFAAVFLLLAGLFLGWLYWHSPPRNMRPLIAQAEKGNPEAQVQIGLSYELGVDGEAIPEYGLQNYAEALKWYRQAANQGYSPAQAKMGYFYKEGMGVQQSWVDAYFWYSLAASIAPPTPEDGFRSNVTEAAKHLTSAQIAVAQARIGEWKSFHKEINAHDGDAINHAFNKRMRIEK
jgi:hypothetical protein